MKPQTFEMRALDKINRNFHRNKASCSTLLDSGKGFDDNKVKMNITTTRAFTHSVPSLKTLEEDLKVGKNNQEMDNIGFQF